CVRHPAFYGSRSYFDVW
nr:immunoglobulin heavy chain junction region [Mus musculus]